MKYDVHVVGGGVSGGFISTLLAKDGYKVLISEEDKEIGLPKHCTGVLSTRALESTNITSTKIILNKLYGSRIYEPNFKVSIDVSKREVQAYLVDRPMLDQLLINKAVDLGAELRLGDKIDSLSKIEGKYVIGADGPRSKIAQLYNLPPIKEYVIGYQEHIESKDIINDHKVDVFLSAKYFPGFFGWFVPLRDGEGIIGYATKPNAAGNRNKRIKKMLSAKGILSFKSRESFGGLIPLQMRPKVNNGPALLIGDAGGFTKATTGGGVLFSTLSARKAVKAIKEEKPENYEKYVKEIQEELKIHRRLRVFYNFVPDIILGLGLHVGKPFGLEKWLVSKGDMDYASRLFSRI